MPRICGLAILFLLAAFLTLTLGAGLLYPGGTWCDRASPGFDLASNFLCDLLHRRALNGALNPGAPLAQAAMVSLSLALVPFWLGIAHLSRARSKLASAVRALGVLSALGTLLVSFNPSDRWPSLHQLSVLTTAAAALAAALGGAAGLASSPRGRRLAAIALVTLALAAVDAGLYLQQVIAPTECAVVLPVLQKFAGISALVWMLAIATRLLGESRLSASGATRSRAA